MRSAALGPGFGRYWAGAAISSFGTAVTAVAMPFLVVEQLGASGLQLGLVNAAQLLPYAAFGLLAGTYVDRHRRRPVLLWSSAGRAVCLGIIPVLWLTGDLRAWMLVVALLAFGTFSVLGFAATQSLLPRLVPRSALVDANARLDRTDAASQTLGPTVGGALVGLVGPPLAIAVDAVSYALEAVLVATLRVDEPAPQPSGRTVRTEVREGLEWTYRHPVLGRLALSTHLWFLANGAVMTALPLLALRELRLSPGAFGVLMAVLGVSTLAGSWAAPGAGRRFGVGGAVVMARAAYPVAWLLAVLLGTGSSAVVAVGIGLTILGLAAGVENANEMGLWQSRTPDRLLGRVNGARRSVNRTCAAAGAVLGGALAGGPGTRPTLLLAAAVFAVAALVLGQAVRRAGLDDHSVP